MREAPLPLFADAVVQCVSRSERQVILVELQCRAQRILLGIARGRARDFNCPAITAIVPHRYMIERDEGSLTVTPWLPRRCVAMWIASRRQPVKHIEGGRCAHHNRGD